MCGSGTSIMRFVHASSIIGVGIVEIGGDISNSCCGIVGSIIEVLDQS